MFPRAFVWIFVEKFFLRGKSMGSYSGIFPLPSVCFTQFAHSTDWLYEAFLLSLLFFLQEVWKSRCLVWTGWVRSRSHCRFAGRMREPGRETFPYGSGPVLLSHSASPSHPQQRRAHMDTAVFSPADLFHGVDDSDDDRGMTIKSTPTSLATFHSRLLTACS